MTKIRRFVLAVFYKKDKFVLYFQHAVTPS